MVDFKFAGKVRDYNITKNELVCEYTSLIIEF